MSKKLFTILNEEATPQEVSDSIKKRYRVEINYLDDENAKKGEGRRIIEPVTYGLSKAGNPVIRAFQPFGDTKTKVPHWKMFRLDKIINWKPYKNNHFNEPPQGQWNADGKYNPNGDKSMSTVYLSADFTGSQAYQKGEGSFKGLKSHNDKLHAQKLEKDPYADLKKNIKNSVMATPEIMKRIELSQREKLNKPSNRQNVNASEMSSIKNFGDNEQQTTEGPIRKNNVETQTQQQVQQPKYDEVVKNGPQYKQKETDIKNNNEEDINNNND